jgi:hypothetical protein
MRGRAELLDPGVEVRERTLQRGGASMCSSSAELRVLASGWG